MTTPSIPTGLTFSDRYREMRWCFNCGGDQVSISMYECEAGRVVVCLGCEEQRLIPFSRVTQEAA